eukprot:scaffold63427_cov40-Phaeocystis_antarctica.AAC.1
MPAGRHPHGNKAEVMLLKDVFCISESGKVQDRRCSCRSGEDETRFHWRSVCERSAAAIERVERVGAEMLAASGSSFYFEVTSRVSYWGGSLPELSRATYAGGRPDDGWEQRQDASGLVDLWAGTAPAQGLAAVVTKERLACLAVWWEGEHGISMRRAVRELLVGCLIAAPRKKVLHKQRKQDNWRPESELAAEGTADEQPDTAAAEPEQQVEGGAETWLGGINDAEKAAIAKKEHDDQERLAACARALGFAPGENVAISETKSRYKSLAKQLHPDKDWSDVSTEAFKVLHTAQEAPTEARRSDRPSTPATTDRDAATTRRPYGDGARLEPQQPPPPSPPPKAATTAAEVRQVPPALRKWLRTHMLGDGAGEALQSPQTATHGIFCKVPIMHEALVAGTNAAEWSFGIDAVSSRDWVQEPWPHNVVVTVEEEEQVSLDRIIAKARQTERKGRSVVLVVATSRPWELLRKTSGARTLLRLPPEAYRLATQPGGQTYQACGRMAMGRLGQHT